MKCLKFPAKACDLLTCHTKGKCLWHDDFATTPKEPEAVHGNEAGKVVNQCSHCKGLGRTHVGTKLVRCFLCGGSGYTG